MDFFAEWMLIGAGVIFPFMTKEFIYALADRSKRITSQFEHSKNFNIIALMAIGLMFVVALWPVVIAITIGNLTFFDPDDK